MGSARRVAVKWAGIAAGAALLVFSNLASAAEAGLDGAALLAYCEHAERDDPKANVYRAGACIGFIQGTLKGWEAAASVRKARLNYCITPGLKFDGILRAVTTYLRADPSRLHGKAELLVISAVQQAFPCAPGSKKKR